MDPAKVQSVQQSLGRCLLNRAPGKDFLDAFYDEFIASDPRIRPLFARTDMAKQKDLLRQGLMMMIMYANESNMAKLAVDRLAVQHDHEHLNIEPGMYRLWLDSLLKCIKEYDSKFDKTVGDAWNEVLAPGVAVMRQAY